MNTELLAKTWDSLHANHLDLIQSFYLRFFERFPNYRSLFPSEMDNHMRRMVDTMAMVSRLADHNDVIESRMLNVGDRHRHYGLAREDLDNFRDVFIEVLEENCRGQWNADCRDAWKEAFDSAVLPLVMRGLGHGEAAATGAKKRRRSH
jgi:hemoglobin-like flavoprotein